MKNDTGVLLLWLGRKLARNHEALITKMDAIQNLFETSAEATATPSDILEGKTAYNGTILMTGAMENQGAKEATLLAGGTYNIPRGYHDGAGRVMATDLASQTPGTAAAGGILSGLKAWVAGKLVDGAMKDRRGTTVTAAAVTQDDNYTYLSIPEEACYDGSSKVRTENSNITPTLKICGIAKPGGAPVTVPKAGCYIIYMSTQGGREPAQPENTEVILEPTYFSVATIGVYIAVYKSTDVTSVVCTGSNYNYVQGAIVLAP